MVQPAFPPDGDWFWGVDAFSLDVHPGNPWVHDPGPFNQSKAYDGTGVEIVIFLHFGSFGLVPLHEPATLYNVDVDIALYDISGPTVRPTGIKAAFTAPYGSASNGKWLEHSCKPGVPHVTRVEFGDTYPLMLRLVTPTGGPGAFQLGARILFFSGITSPQRCHYEYTIHGCAKQV